MDVASERTPVNAASRRIWSPRLLLNVVALGGSALAAVGCGSKPQSTATLNCNTTSRTFTQSFPEGIARITDDGNADMLLSCRTESKAASAPAVDQVVHIRVQWQMGFKVKQENRQAAQNAVIRWYVSPAGQSEGGKPQLIEYVGSGHVELKRDGDEVVAIVEDATLAPAVCTAKMSDPIGPARLNGTFLARRDNAATVARLNDLRATVATVRPAGRQPAGQQPAARIE
jgi:hypothetical protein